MSQRMVAIATLCIVLLGIAAVALAGGRESPGAAPDAPALAGVSGADPDNAQLVALGSELYGSYCASCHGRNLEGQAGWQNELPGGGRLAPPHDASGHTWHHPDELLFNITKFGGQPYSPEGYRNNMPAFGGALSDAQIWAIISYIQSRWPPEIREAQERAQ